MDLSCLVVRDDKTVAYIHPIHEYNPKGTPRPLVKKEKKNITKKSSSGLTDEELLEILRLYL